jgi:hypothetical protein
VVAAALLLTQPAHTFVPTGERIARAIAEANAAAGRSSALLFRLTLHIGDSDALATGELLSHPSGLARLELKGAKNLVERHLLQGTEHTASRNGGPLPEPRAFLPPLFFLQVDTPTSLRAALAAFGVYPDHVALAPCGETDCFVIGDPFRVPPSADSDAAIEAGKNPEPGPESAGGEFDVRVESDTLVTVEAPPATIWVEIHSYRIVKIELSDGVVVDLGPVFVRDQLEVPSWITITEPERTPVRFDFESVTPVSVPARAFSEAWLISGESAPQGPPGSPTP